MTNEPGPLSTTGRCLWITQAFGFGIIAALTLAGLIDRLLDRFRGRNIELCRVLEPR